MRTVWLGGSTFFTFTRRMLIPVWRLSKVSWINSRTSTSTLARSRFKIGANSDSAITSRIAASEIAITEDSGERSENLKSRAFLTFQTTSKSMSTMFSSVVSIRPSLPDVRATPIVSVRLVVTSNTSALTSGQGAKFRPSVPMPENSPRNNSIDCCSGRTV